ncbi:MAG: helix-turn-helix domain-containing protein [Hydrogeniiclostridium mannosilyticum]
MEINYLEIGQRIRKARLAAKVTQEQLAEKLGVGTTHISHIETGNSIPSQL